MPWSLVGEAGQPRPLPGSAPVQGLAVRRPWRSQPCAQGQTRSRALPGPLSVTRQRRAQSSLLRGIVRPEHSPHPFRVLLPAPPPRGHPRTASSRQNHPPSPATVTRMCLPTSISSVKKVRVFFVLRSIIRSMKRVPYRAGQDRPGWEERERDS